MLTHRASRRALLKSLAMIAAGTVVSACGPRPSAPEAGKPPAETNQTANPPTAVGKATNILFYAAGATPTDPNAQLPEGQSPKVALQKIADAYRALHPNVQIDWYRFPENVAKGEWLTARMAAQDCPDIYQCLPEDLWPHVNKGWALPFDDAMNLPNPYLSGNAAWRDQFLDVALNYATGPDGKLYSAIMDAMGIMVSYNKTTFDQLGIKPPTRWPWLDFMSACEELKKAGYIPIAGDLSYENWYPEWVTGPILNQFIWDTVLKADDDGNGIVQSKEVAIHLQKGDFPDLEADLQVSKLLKTTVPYLPEGWQGKLDLIQLFRMGKCAIMFSGSWNVVNFDKDPPPFEISWVDAPIVTKALFPNVPEKVIRTLGAWGITNWHIPGYLAKQDPDKVGVVFDWLKFVSVPDNVTTLCAEASMIPTVKGAKTIPSLEKFLAPYDRATPYQGWENLSEDAYRMELELWEAYLPSNMSDDEFLELAKAKLQEALRLVLEQNPDWKIG